MAVWPADQSVFDLVEKVKKKSHNHLDEANVAVCIKDAKAFVRNRFNWGSTTRFSPTAKVWHPEDKRYDFLITLASDAWNILTANQKEALVDLRVSCMQVEYEPEFVEENGKKKPVKDKWGRQVYTNIVKVDDEGNPKWKVVPLDLHVIQDNVSRYGCWCQDLIDLKSVIKDSELRLTKSEVKIEEING